MTGPFCKSHIFCTMYMQIVSNYTCTLDLLGERYLMGHLYLYYKGRTNNHPGGGPKMKKKLVRTSALKRKIEPKILRKIKNPTIDFPPYGIMVKSEKKSGQASVQTLFS